jgi:hypothetical protein
MPRAQCAGSAPASTSSRASANVFSFVPLKHERSRVGHQRRIKASRNLGRKFHPSFPRQPKNHFRRRHGMRIDPVHVGERPPADMMINADQKPVFQAFEPRAVNAVAFQNNRRFVTARSRARLHHLIGKRQANGKCAGRHRAAQRRRACPSRAEPGSKPAPIPPHRRRAGRATSARIVHAVRSAGARPRACRYAFFPLGSARGPCAPCSSFSPAPAILPPAPFQCSARSSRNTIPERASSRNRSTSSCRIYSFAPPPDPPGSRSASSSSPSTFTHTCADRPSSAISHCRHAHQPNPRIGQLAFHQRFNLLAQSFAHPPAMIFQPTLLHETAPQGKLMRISENRAQACGPRKPHCRALSWAGISTEVTTRYAILVWRRAPSPVRVGEARRSSTA